MILVNNPGDWDHIYPPLEHSAWNGCTPTDLIFPFFLFIVGVSIPYALENKINDPVQHKKVMPQILRRALLIFALGILMRLFPRFDFATLRIPGVLQRIAIVYLACAMLYTRSSKKAMSWILGLILIIYYMLMNWIPVPGVGDANLEPGMNLAAWLDNLVFTQAHMWNQTKTWDPEGILSTVPAIGTGLMGVLTGIWLRRKDRMQAERVAWLFFAGIVSVIMAMIWDPFFPINKSLWTSSFVLYTGGFAIIGLTLSYWLIDVQGIHGFTKPFVVYGANAITVFVVSGILPTLLNFIKVNDKGVSTSLLPYLYQRFFTPNFTMVNASLAWAIVYVLIFLVPLWMMYNRKIFIKI